MGVIRRPTIKSRAIAIDFELDFIKQLLIKLKNLFLKRLVNPFRPKRAEKEVGCEI
jgi:hypothetical protein